MIDPSSSPADPLPPRREAIAAFHPTNFGFRPDHGGWLTQIPRASIAIAALNWQHTQSSDGPSPYPQAVPASALDLLVELQRTTWGMPPEDLVPTNLLAVLADSGGSVLVAYDPDLGFTPGGWLGFAIALGARNGTLVSHMLGVRPDRRGVADLGWSLKVIQGYEALRAGHTAATWTFDPMRGANARLNLEKLGAVVDRFTVDKYGALRTALYGDVPSDRFTARWDLCSSRVLARLPAVHAHTHPTLGPAALAVIPEATPQSLAAILADPPPRLRYRIPGDIDRLPDTDPTAAIGWRQQLRVIMSSLLHTSRVSHWAENLASADPRARRTVAREGRYVIDGFTSHTNAGERLNYYLLRRLDLHPPRESA